MSHYWRDRAYKLQDRRRELMKELRTIGLRHLTVADLLDIIEVVRPSYSMHDFNEDDAKTLEGVIARSRR